MRNEYLPSNRAIKTQSGRSMIEILGVITIIGVLTLVALWGFRWAIEKYRANEILEGVRERGADIFYRYQPQTLPEGSEDEDTLEHAFEEWTTLLLTGHTAIITSHPDFGGFKVWVDNVEKGVCEKILDMEPLENNNIPGLQMIRIMGEQFLNNMEICPEDLAQMEFVFLLDPDADFAPDVPNCLTDKNCQTKCGGQMICNKAGHICTCPNSASGREQVCNPSTNMCEEIRKCIQGSEFRTKEGACVPGASAGSYEILPGTEPYTFTDADGNEIKDDASPAELCRQSNENRWTSMNADSEDAEKAECYIGCPAGLGFVPKDTYKDRSIWQNDREAVAEYNNSCISCNNPYDFAPTDASDCAKCGLETYTSDVYPDTKICSHPCPEGQLKVSGAHAHGFGTVGYHCVSKPEDEDDRIDFGIPQEAKYKTICAEDWEWQNQLEWCIKPCGANEFMKAVIWGKNWASASACYACNYQYPVQIAKIADFDSYPAQLAALKKQCTDCGRTLEETSDGFLVCLASADPCKENEFLNKDNTCVSCDEPNAQVIAGSSSGCETKCMKQVINSDGGVTLVPTRWIVAEKSWNKFFCLKKCEENQFQTWKGVCYDCDTDGSVEISYADNNDSTPQLSALCNSCVARDDAGNILHDENGNPIQLRELLDQEHYCVLNTCEEGYVRNNKGTCEACSSDKDVINISKTGSGGKKDQAQCNACPYVSTTNQGRAVFKDGNTWDCVKINPGVMGSCNSLGDPLGRNPYEAGDGVLFMNSYKGTCHSCDTTEGILTSQAQCETCSNRQYINDTCYPFSGCEAKEEFWNTSIQNCSKCSIKDIKVLTKTVDTELCNACVDAKGVHNRRAMTQDGAEGTQTYCVKICPENEWQDIDGVCWTKDMLTKKEEIGTDSVSRSLCSKAGGIVSTETDEDEDDIEHVYCSPSNN